MIVNDICCVFNVAPHYNEPIYKLIDQELNCDFYIGDKIHLPIKLMDYSTLKGFKSTLEYKPLFLNFYWQKGVSKIKFRKYNHIIITGEPFCISTWFILFVSKIYGIKTYLWTHGWYGNESFLKKIIKKLFFNLASKTLLYGDYAKNLMIKAGFNSKKLVPIYNSLDYNVQLKVRNNLTETNIYTDFFGNDYPVLIYVGRIQVVKKLEMILESISVLKKSNHLCNLIVVGEEVEKTFFKNRINELELTNNVWLYGPCFEESILGELFYNACVCVSPGNVGLTAIHSLMFGTPVITHNNFCRQMPEFESITDNINGSFFEEDNLQNLIEKIKYWTSINKDLKENVRQKCFQIIDQKFNPNIQIKILKDLFK